MKSATSSVVSYWRVPYESEPTEDCLTVEPEVCCNAWYPEVPLAIDCLCLLHACRRWSLVAVWLSDGTYPKHPKRTECVSVCTSKSEANVSLESHSISACLDVYEGNGIKSLSGIYVVNKTGEICGEASIKVCLKNVLTTVVVTTVNVSVHGWVFSYTSYWDESYYNGTRPIFCSHKSLK